MALGPLLIGSLVVGGGLAGGALLSRALYRRFGLEPLEDQIEILDEEYVPWEYVDIESAMPTQLDFPQGWELHDEGADGNDNWAMRWKILELNSPPYAGPHFVAVFSAHAPDFAKDGWIPPHTRDDAFEQLNLVRHQAQAAGAAAS